MMAILTSVRWYLIVALIHAAQYKQQQQQQANQKMGRRSK